MLQFDACAKYHKSVTGAIAAGDSLRLSVVLPRSFGVTCCRVILEHGGEQPRYISMDWASTDGNEEWWTKELYFGEAGIYFYHFSYDTSWGTTFLMRDGESQRASVNGRNVWQQTVYTPGLHTPDGMKNGVIYQIFPDRFRFSGIKKENVPPDRILRNDTENLPVWEPDKDGKIKNNDFFCGDFKGIEEKLDYIASLGTSVIYLNPIGESHSNHRYDTADYLKPDPLLGTEADFVSLVKAAHERGIKIILDGVYSHTGDDSVYFNKYGRYGESGAFNDENSPYRRWYTFKKDGSYSCWWDIDTLPEVKENEPSFTDFITGENGVMEHWLSLGADGFRLDVADELPDEFIDRARARVKEKSPDNYFLGEVWEDATNKVSYGVLRRYLLGGQFDGVMNYPFRKSVIDFLLSSNAERFMDEVYSVVLNYPPQALNACMNMLGTHDTARILTVLTGINLDKMTRNQQAKISLSPAQKSRAEKLVKMAVPMIYTLPGIPCVYYGDEAGMYGAKDPFNRCCYPWGRENSEILELYKFFGRVRKGYPVLQNGGFYPLSAEMGCAAYLRYSEGMGRIAAIANNNPHEITYSLNYDMREMTCIYGGENIGGAVVIPANTAAVLAD